MKFAKLYNIVIVAAALAAPALTQGVHVVPRGAAKSTTPTSLGPLSFRGFAPNMSLSRFREQYAARAKNFPTYAQLKCVEPAAGLNECSDNYDGLVGAHFVGDEMSDASWMIESGQVYVDTREALIEKFGRPSVAFHAYQNRMGAKFRGEVSTWHVGDVILRIEQRGYDLDTPLISITSLRLTVSYKAKLGHPKADI